MSLLLSPPDPRGVLLFAPGAGGDPSRYRRLLEAVCDAGFVVAATEHELLDRRTATPAALRARVADLRAPLEWFDPELPVVVAGHSAGGWAALCLLGAAAHDRQGRELDTRPSRESPAGCSSLRPPRCSVTRRRCARSAPS